MNKKILSNPQKTTIGVFPLLEDDLKNLEAMASQFIDSFIQSIKNIIQLSSKSPRITSPRVNAQELKGLFMDIKKQDALKALYQQYFDLEMKLDQVLNRLYQQDASDEQLQNWKVVFEVLREDLYSILTMDPLAPEELITQTRLRLDIKKYPERLPDILYIGVGTTVSQPDQQLPPFLHAIIQERSQVVRALNIGPNTELSTSFPENNDVFDAAFYECHLFNWGKPTEDHVTRLFLNNRRDAEVFFKQALSSFAPNEFRFKHTQLRLEHEFKHFMTMLAQADKQVICLDSIGLFGIVKTLYDIFCELKVKFPRQIHLIQQVEDLPALIFKGKADNVVSVSSFCNDILVIHEKTASFSDNPIKEQVISTPLTEVTMNMLLSCG